MKKLMMIVASAAMLVSCGGKSGKPDFGDNEYAVRTVGVSNTQLETTYPAVFKGQQDVEIRPKVSGFITRINVKEGQTVSVGQVLFEIDNVTFKAAVNQAQATVTAAESNLNTAKLRYENSEKLFANNVIGDFELRSAKNAYESAQATLGQARATLTQAKDQLSFCYVKSPAAGVIGALPYKVGALVSPSIADPLTTVSNGSKVEVYFSMSEKDVIALTKQYGSLNGALTQMPAVKLKLADGSVYDSMGKVVKASGIIDPATGSTYLVADFPNARNILKSGGSGHVLMPHTATGAIIIPQNATVEVQDKHFVYIVGKDNKVKYTEIGIEDVNDGLNYIVTSGLKKGDRIVVDGVTRLNEGMEIKPITEAELKKKIDKAVELGKVQDKGVLAVVKALKS
jgi:membrane fusion protein (multidrug efflux system)